MNTSPKRTAPEWKNEESTKKKKETNNSPKRKTQNKNCVSSANPFKTKKEEKIELLIHNTMGTSSINSNQQVELYTLQIWLF